MFGWEGDLLLNESTDSGGSSVQALYTYDDDGRPIQIQRYVDGRLSELEQIAWDCP